VSSLFLTVLSQVSFRTIVSFIFHFDHVYSLRSREEERISKPGAPSTPVKHGDDHTPNAVEEVTAERNEKQTPTLPGV
jgi:hypothetical protein